MEAILNEWENLIEELSQKEIALYEWKQVYNIKSEEITAHTDFKAIYGANNQKVRDNHVRNELADWYENIKDLEFSIDYITRRISYLRELVKCKRTIMEVTND
jgi:mRNA-degrading endonuclease HigB of HigAB toxin-antitoxin module